MSDLDFPKFPEFPLSLGEELGNFYQKKNIPKVVVLGSKQPKGSGELVGKFFFENERKVVLIFGGVNSGKSSVASRFAEEGYYKFGIPFLWIDPQKEYLSHKQPLREQFVMPLMKHEATLVGRPIGMDFVVVTPHSLVDAVDEVGLSSSIHLNDFMRLKDKQVAANLLMELLEISGSGFVAARRQFDVVIENVRAKFDSTGLCTFVDLERAINRYLKRQRGEERRNSYVIEEKVRSLIRGKVVEVEGTVGCNVVDFLVAGKNVLLHTSLDRTRVNEYDVQISLMLQSVLENYNLFPHGVGILADEFENIAGAEDRKDSFLKQIMRQIPLKFRKRNIWLIGITQLPKSVDPYIISQANNFLYANLNFDGVQHLVKNSTMTVSMLTRILEPKEFPNVCWTLVSPFNSFVDKFSGEFVSRHEFLFALPPRGQFNFKGLKRG